MEEKGKTHRYKRSTQTQMKLLASLINDSTTNGVLRSRPPQDSGIRFCVQQITENTFKKLKTNRHLFDFFLFFFLPV